MTHRIETLALVVLLLIAICELPASVRQGLAVKSQLAHDKELEQLQFALMLLPLVSYGALMAWRLVGKRFCGDMGGGGVGGGVGGDGNRDAGGEDCTAPTAVKAPSHALWEPETHAARTSGLGAMGVASSAISTSTPDAPSGSSVGSQCALFSEPPALPLHSAGMVVFDARNQVVASANYGGVLWFEQSFASSNHGVAPFQECPEHAFC